MTLLEQFARSELVHGLSLGEKALGSCYVAALGMSITFLALVVLMSSLVVMSRIVNRKGPNPPPPPPRPLPSPGGEENPGERLGVVLAAAAWAALGAPARIVNVRPLRRERDDTSAWARAGRMEQIRGGRWQS
ncbi:MAG TPA: OadG family protein [bacterium]|nr:OadG family protein [bacterium]HPQ65491.1 OadG family protein [bacterium]